MSSLRARTGGRAARGTDRQHRRQRRRKRRRVKEGIIDPKKVVRSALQNAASVATLLLTSDALVADVPKDEKKKAGAGADNDMY